jgi:hypothetical protein
MILREEEQPGKCVNILSEYNTSFKTARSLIKNNPYDNYSTLTKAKTLLSKCITLSENLNEKNKKIETYFLLSQVLADLNMHEESNEMLTKCSNLFSMKHEDMTNSGNENLNSIANLSELKMKIKVFIKLFLNYLILPLNELENASQFLKEKIEMILNSTEKNFENRLTVFKNIIKTIFTEELVNYLIFNSNKRFPTFLKSFYDEIKNLHSNYLNVTRRNFILINTPILNNSNGGKFKIEPNLKILLKNLFEGDNLNCLIKYFNDKFYTLKYPEKEKISDVQKIVDALNKNLDLFKNKNFDKLIRTADNILKLNKITFDIKKISCTFDSFMFIWLQRVNFLNDTFGMFFVKVYDNFFETEETGTGSKLKRKILENLNFVNLKRKLILKIDQEKFEKLEKAEKSEKDNKLETSHIRNNFYNSINAIDISKTNYHKNKFFLTSRNLNNLSHSGNLNTSRTGYQSTNASKSESRRKLFPLCPVILHKKNSNKEVLFINSSIIGLNLKKNDSSSYITNQSTSELKNGNLVLNSEPNLEPKFRSKIFPKMNNINLIDTNNGKNESDLKLPNISTSLLSNQSFLFNKSEKSELIDNLTNLTNFNEKKIENLENSDKKENKDSENFENLLNLNKNEEFLINKTENINNQYQDSNVIREQNAIPIPEPESASVKPKKKGLLRKNTVSYYASANAEKADDENLQIAQTSQPVQYTLKKDVDTEKEICEKPDNPTSLIEKVDFVSINSNSNFNINSLREKEVPINSSIKLLSDLSKNKEKPYSNFSFKKKSGSPMLNKFKIKDDSKNRQNDINTQSNNNYFNMSNQVGLFSKNNFSRNYHNNNNLYSSESVKEIANLIPDSCLNTKSYQLKMPKNIKNITGSFNMRGSLMINEQNENFVSNKKWEDFSSGYRYKSFKHRDQEFDNCKINFLHFNYIFSYN